MKPNRTLLPVITPQLLTTAGLFTALAANAATGPLADPGSAGGPASPGPWEMLIPVLVPVAIAGLKFLVPKVPPAWLPIIAPVLGAALEITMHFAGLSTGNGVVGALLGSAGVGLREIVDQLRKTSVSQ